MSYLYSCNKPALVGLQYLWADQLSYPVSFNFDKLSDLFCCDIWCGPVVSSVTKFLHVILW